MRDTHVLNIIFVCILSINLISGQTSKKDLLKQTKLPSCRACKVYVDSFKKGIAKTENGKFEGGDAAWEEEKLRKYSHSEVRLVEVQEHVCSDVEEGQDQCYSLNEQYDQAIETWWFQEQQSTPDLFQYLCIEQMKQCCPVNHYGENCLQCPGFPDNICGNNGRCKGAGTRKGSGHCICDEGYAGVLCNECSVGYFEAYRDESVLLCSPCHGSCDGGCNAAGPKGCVKCLPGWVAHEERGCLDVNECATSRPCLPSKFCVNSEGSYKCLECDKSCSGCTGDGPDMCNNCASGFVLKEGRCVDAEQESRQRYILFTRYATYLGLCVATCIIFQKSYVLAAVIGLVVAIYISTSEYILNSVSGNDTSEIASELLRMASNAN